MADYSYAQIEQLWIQNGGNPAIAPLAAAIAEAESSGNAGVTSSNPDGGTNVGLWQLDTPGGGGAGYSIGQLQDPNTNAKVAIQASGNGTNWSSWETFVNGAYRQFLQGNVPPSATLTSSNNPPPAKSAGTGVGVGPIQWITSILGISGNINDPVGRELAGPQGMANPFGALSDIAGTLNDLGHNLAQIMKWTAWLFSPSNWLRIGAFLVGIATFIGGLYMLKEAV